jgi:uncharacterized surface protein with fasciclin (FAS1) repeats
MKNQIIKLTSIFTLVITLFSCTDDDNKTIVKLPTILEIAQADQANFSILIAALNKTGLNTTVSGPGSYTVFAPTNAAMIAGGVTEASIAALNPTSTLPADVSAVSSVRRLLQNHILGVATNSEDLLVAGYVKTFASGIGSTTLSMYIEKAGNDVQINGGTAIVGAKVTSANIAASNGIVHVVDGILKLPKLVDHIKINPSLNTLESIVTTTAFGDQSAVLGLINMASTNAVYATNNTNPAMTIFAPTDSAFATATASGGYLTGANFDPATNLAANVTKVLQYHVSQSLPFTAPSVATVGNLTPSSATSWTSATATGPTTIRTIALNAVPANQTFTIERNTLKIKEFPVIVAPAIIPPASNIKTVNIQATNGVIHTIDRVLQPVL